MAVENLARYPLAHDGAIGQWLACGPVTSPLDGLERVLRPDGSPFGRGRRWAISNAPDSLDLKARAYNELARPGWRPGERPALDQQGPGGQKRWRYVTVGEDHVVDMSLFNFALTWMQGWLYACLQCSQPLSLPAELFSVGPAQVWLNGEQVIEHRGFEYVEPSVISLELVLSAGWNDLWLYGQMVGWREARMAMGMRLPGAPQVVVGLPLADILEARWQRAERALAHVQLERLTFPERSISLRLDPGAPQPVDIIAEAGIPFPDEHITLPLDTGPFSVLATSKHFNLRPGESAELKVNPQLLEELSYLPNEYHLRLQLRPGDGTPQQANYVLWGRAGDFSQSPYGSYESRQREALEHLAHMSYAVTGAIAAVRTGKAEIIAPEAVDLACSFLEKRYDCADFYAIDLLVCLYLYGNQTALRPSEKKRIEQAFWGFKFWIDEPGLDAMCYHTENHQILFHASAYLAGQLWPERIFPNSGLTGRQQTSRARERISEWILRRLGGAFSEWDSSSYLALDAYAMLALAEFAGSLRLRRMASALLDKIFFSLACQSWRGVHGCSHGRAYASTLKSARLENTSGMQRLAWGMGTFNGENRAIGLLALSRRYKVPELIQQIGADLPAELLTYACSNGRYRPHFDLKSGSWEVNTLTCRTPDGMLSAALDYQPGEMGWQEHLWQATLSPEAVVFTNHPGNSREDEISRPNFWAGSARLPRVAMFQSNLACLYDMSLSGGLGFSHAYFPAAAFDEVLLSGRWAFGRVGDGYVALGGDGELCLTAHGLHAGQELRSRGAGQVWVCALGRAAQHGDFARFCRGVSQSPLEINGLQVRWITPEGRELIFGWQGSLQVDGGLQPLGNFLHYENLYTLTPLGADRMIIHADHQRLELDLAVGRRLS